MRRIQKTPTTLRIVTVMMITRHGNTFSDTQRRAVYTRRNGTEFVVLRTRDHKSRRFDLDTPFEIFFTADPPRLNLVS